MNRLLLCLQDMKGRIYKLEYLLNNVHSEVTSSGADTHIQQNGKVQRKLVSKSHEMQDITIRNFVLQKPRVTSHSLMYNLSQLINELEGNQQQEHYELKSVSIMFTPPVKELKRLLILAVEIPSIKGSLVQSVGLLNI